MTIRLHIDRLVLDGINLPPGYAAQLSDAVSTELAVLLQNSGQAGRLSRRGSIARLTAPPIGLLPGHPAGLGRQFADAIYEGLLS